MKFLIPMIASISIKLITAQKHLNQTAPFKLTISAPSSSIDHSFLVSCHEGPAIEGLCLTPSSKGVWSTYSLNYTSQTTHDSVFGITGLLIWDLHGNMFNLSSPMELSYNPISNIAVPLFTPSETGTTVGFNENDEMFIPGYTDDTKLDIGQLKAPYSNWFVCDTYIGYRYTTLAWLMGRNSTPQNPSCQKVDVKREFVLA